MAKSHSWWILLFGLVASTGVGCSGTPIARPSVASPLPARTDVLVIAPHPDDEVLMAGGVLHDAVRRGQSVAVVVMTNGDLSCERDGYRREQETIEALAVLGVPEEVVSFLGYPDGHLADLNALPLPPLERRAADGTCVQGTTTYGNRGRGGHDEHTVRTGHAATYTATSIVEDVTALLERHRPRDVYVSHSIDDHPDHAATYTFFRRALEKSTLSASIGVHRAVVHAGACWPNVASTTHPPCGEEVFRGDRMPVPLPDPLSNYWPTERRGMPVNMRGVDPWQNLKFLALSKYVSQTGPRPLQGWLAQFVRTEEWFFTEQLAPDPERRSPRWRRVNPSSTAALSEKRLPSFPRAAQCPETEGTLQLVSSFSDDPRYFDIEYAFLFDPMERRLKFLRRHEKATSFSTLRLWTLPSDTSSARLHAHAFSIDLQRNPGGSVELSVWYDNEFLFTAVDPGFFPPSDDAGTPLRPAKVRCEVDFMP